MLGITHAAIALAGSTAIIGSAEPGVMLCAVIGSQLPDLDTTKSYIGRIFYPVAKFIEERYPHRSITHCFLFTLAVALAAAPLWYYFNWKYWLALPLGHLLSCTSDTFTKAGVRLFYPNRVICVAGLNPRLRIATGSGGEYMVLVTAVIVWLIAFNVVSSGGLQQQFALNLLTNNETAIKVMRKENQKAVEVQVTGTRRIDNSRVDERFWAFDSSGRTLIVQSSDNKVLRIGSDGEIIPQRVEVKDGRRPIRTRRQRIIDVDAVLWINALSPGARVSGSLEIEDAGEISLPIPPPGAMTTVTKLATGVNLEYAGVTDLKPLEEFYIFNGEVVIKEL